MSRPHPDSLPRNARFEQYLGVSLENTTDRGATASIEANARLHNHHDFLHAGAIFTVCDAASRAVLEDALQTTVKDADRDLSKQMRYLVRDARMSYLKPATRRLTASAKLIDDPAALIDELMRLDRAEAMVDVSARSLDEDGVETVVAKASFTWSLRRK
jgi:acyl-coenzyme A thioesterase PaaI-like protein